MVATGSRPEPLVLWDCGTLFRLLSLVSLLSSLFNSDVFVQAKVYKYVVSRLLLWQDNNHLFSSLVLV